MHKHIISGTVKLPAQKRQKQLHEQLSAFAHWMQRPKTGAKFRKTSAGRCLRRCYRWFSKSLFLPRLQENKTVQRGQKIAEMQKDFYASLSRLLSWKVQHRQKRRKHLSSALLFRHMVQESLISKQKQSSYWATAFYNPVLHDTDNTLKIGTIEITQESQNYSVTAVILSLRQI